MVQTDIDHLLIDFLQGKATPQQEQELSQWRNSSRENAAYFNGIKNMWYKIASSGDTPADSEIAFELSLLKNNIQPDTAPSEKRKPRRIVGVLKAAAIIAAAAAIGLAVNMFTAPLFRSNASPELVAPAGNGIVSFESQRGCLSLVKLTDGSEVVLNAGSTLTYDVDQYDRQTRTVSLSGEAYFHVKSNPDIPFVVKVKALNVVAKGTEFNIKAYPEESLVTTTLQSGILGINGLSNSNKPFSVSLQPNQTLVYCTDTDDLCISQTENIEEDITSAILDNMQNNNIPAVKLSNVRTELYVSWKDKNWMVSNEPLASLAGKLERRYDVNITFSDRAAAEYRFTGSFEKETIEEVLAVLRGTTPIKYTINKGNVMIAHDKMRQAVFDSVRNK